MSAGWWGAPAGSDPVSHLRVAGGEWCGSGDVAHPVAGGRVLARDGRGADEGAVANPDADPVSPDAIGGADPKGDRSGSSVTATGRV